MTPFRSLQTEPGHIYVLARLGGEEPRNVVETPSRLSGNETSANDKRQEERRSAARGKVGGATSGFWRSDITGSGLDSSGELQAAKAGGDEGSNDFPSNAPRDARDAVTQLSKLSSLTTPTLIEAGVHKHRLGT